MSLITYFRANLTCLFCKRLGTAWVWSKLGDLGATYNIGDRVADDIPMEEIEDVCLKVNPASPDDALHILLSWNCTYCGLTNFAKLILQNGYVRSIEAIELNSTTLETLHYIAESIADMLETIVGESLYNKDEPEIRPDWLVSLRRALASGRRW